MRQNIQEWFKRYIECHFEDWVLSMISIDNQPFYILFLYLIMRDIFSFSHKMFSGIADLISFRHFLVDFYLQKNIWIPHLSCIQLNWNLLGTWHKRVKCTVSRTFTILTTFKLLLHFLLSQELLHWIHHGVCPWSSMCKLSLFAAYCCVFFGSVWDIFVMDLMFYWQDMNWNCVELGM